MLLTTYHLSIWCELTQIDQGWSQHFGFRGGQSLQGGKISKFL